ncbi:hypothetical protein Har1131_17680 [Haloarcula sp. CBA1131]|uniref:hypothetical protein n=1 Tax=Haloarcula sp. CBA1131 TaxID=1853686 RepID=UPI001245AA60|nr:hypothetical protein [Haloarcula sp. CBA1131]KAA9400805.1 hypothetical protein Har1131_19265 [Haloarcula sp. CBA1131]KAA9404190.1 hypothetical protein Har1131_17680 [Haloarcula sp. CBA1131]
MCENKTDETAVQQCDDLDIDPDAVDIGDGLKTAEDAPEVVVSGVDAEKERVKVYSPSGELTVNRWVSMDLFSVHSPNEDIQTDADREAWLNETLPKKSTHIDGNVYPLRYAIDEDGNVIAK